jgi:hypothetical protein
MPGLMPGIHVLTIFKDVDGRDKPGHDAERIDWPLAHHARHSGPAEGRPEHMLYAGHPRLDYL